MVEGILENESLYFLPTGGKRVVVVPLTVNRYGYYEGYKSGVEKKKKRKIRSLDGL